MTASPDPPCGLLQRNARGLDRRRPPRGFVDHELAQAFRRPHMPKDSSNIK
jgi:hypothetical protein